jgi:hypothetical protein
LKITDLPSGQTKIVISLGASEIGASRFPRAKSSPIGHSSVGYGINPKVFQQSSLRTSHVTAPKAIHKDNSGDETSKQIINLIMHKLCVDIHLLDQTVIKY